MSGRQFPCDAWYVDPMSTVEPVTITRIAGEWNATERWQATLLYEGFPIAVPHDPGNPLLILQRDIFECEVDALVEAVSRATRHADNLQIASISARNHQNQLQARLDRRLASTLVSTKASETKK